MQNRYRMASIFFMTLALLIFSAHLSQSQPKPDAAPAVGQAYLQFWAKFRAAVLKGDKAEVVQWVSLPFDSLDQQKFTEQFDKIFTPKVLQCFKTAKPIPDDPLFNIFCGSQVWRFGPVPGGYKLMEASDAN